MWLDCLISLDAPAARKIWAQFCSERPQPKDDSEALAMLHYARTVSESVPVRMRTYSDEWLRDNGLPSGLPDELKPDRPQIAEAVGVSVKSISGATTKLAAELQRAMSDSVLESYADGVSDPVKIKAHMLRAYQKVIDG